MTCETNEKIKASLEAAQRRAEEVPFDQARFDEIFEIAENDPDGDITVGKLKDGD